MADREQPHHLETPAAYEWFRAGRQLQRRGWPSGELGKIALKQDTQDPHR